MENFENVFLSGPYGKEKKKFQFYHYGYVFTRAIVIAPAGFWPLGQNPRRHPRIPRVYI